MGPKGLPAPVLRTADERLAGFRAGLEATGGTRERVVRPEFTRDGGYAGTTELLTEGLGDIELVFAVNESWPSAPCPPSATPASPPARADHRWSSRTIGGSR